LRVLIEARKKARDWKITDFEGGDVRLASLPNRIREVFDLTGFTSLFDIYADATEAVGSF
jgi:anti-sigma B factor antagonist